MATDRQGATVAVGDVYLLAGKVLRIEGTRVLVRDAAGKLRHVDAGDVAKVDGALGGHPHDIGDVVDLQAELDAKQTLDATLTALAALNTVVGLLEQTGTDTFTKRAVIGSGTMVDALTLLGWFAAIVHGHSAADITSGVLAAARGGTGHGSYNAGDMLVWNGSSFTRVPIGNEGQVLTVGGDGIPYWADK